MRRRNDDISAEEAAQRLNVVLHSLTDEKLRDAYWEKARLYHPDVTRVEGSAQLFSDATIAFHRLNKYLDQPQRPDYATPKESHHSPPPPKKTAPPPSSSHEPAPKAKPAPRPTPSPQRSRTAPKSPFERPSPQPTASSSRPGEDRREPPKNNGPSSREPLPSIGSVIGGLILYALVLNILLAPCFAIYVLFSIVYDSLW